MDFSNNSNQYLISQQNEYPTQEEIQNNNQNQIQNDNYPPSENNIIPLEVSLPPAQPPINSSPQYPKEAPRTIYNDLNIPNPANQNHNNYYPQANSNIYVNPPPVYNY